MSALLPEAPERYFEPAKNEVLMPLSYLTPTRARPEGIAKARERMLTAYAGTTPRRAPISVRKIGFRKYIVLDGNSTYAVAHENGWTAIVAVVVP